MRSGNAGLLMLALTGCAGGGAASADVGGVVPQNLHQTVAYQRAGRYLVFLPTGYDSGGRWPLLLFLHGAGERGDSLGRVLIHGPLREAERHPGDFPFIMVAPQVPQDGTWETDQLDAVLADAMARYRVDRERVYLTGLSMGGFGTWKLAIRHPRRFAAIAPISGGGERWAACSLRETPVWAFHGAQDQTVPLVRAREMVQALQECGGDVRLTIYPDAGHDAWTRTYQNPELYRWLLQHRRPGAE